MMLSTHAIVGTAVGSLFSTHPLVALGISFASHFAIDALPHWDYKFYSIQKSGPKISWTLSIGKHTKMDIVRVSSDILVGIVISWLLGTHLGMNGSLSALLGFFGILPDILQAVYFKSHPAWLKPLQKFHIGS